MANDPTVMCPNCGEEIKKRAKVCPHCGADEETGWSDGTYLDGIDLPGDSDYEEIRRNEFDPAWPASRFNRRWVIITAVIILGVFLLGALSLLR